MYLCLDPYPLTGDVADRTFSVDSQRVVNRSVACGRCANCVKNRKQDWSGKLIAEALGSASVTFLTLTYRDEPADFPYVQVQRMLKAFRLHLKRKLGVGLRYFVVGEFGGKNGRRHWHCLFFFDRPHVMERMKPGELWRYWPHGWTTIINLPKAELTQTIFYTAKYAVKGVGDDGPRCRGSLFPALGSKFLCELAVDAAKRGIVATGKYTLPGVVWTKGQRSGQHQTFRLVGACKRDWISAYVDEWRRVWDGEPPMSDWLYQWWDEADFASRPKLSEAAPAHNRVAPRVKLSLPPNEARPTNTREFYVGVAPFGEVIRVAVKEETGEARILGIDQPVFSMGELIDGSIAGNVSCTVAQAAEIDDWIWSQRKEDYGIIQPSSETGPKKREGCDAFLRAESFEDILKLRVKYGTIRDIGGIYDADWQPEQADYDVLGDDLSGIPERVAGRLGLPVAKVLGRIGSPAACVRWLESEARRRAERAVKNAPSFSVSSYRCDCCRDEGHPEGCSECGEVRNDTKRAFKPGGAFGSGDKAGSNFGKARSCGVGTDETGVGDGYRASRL